LSGLAGEPVLELDLLRHGEPVGGRRYRGDGVDDPLSEAGWQQMWSAVEGCRPWRRVLSSPLRRAREFAEALAVQCGISCEVDRRWREIGMGAWEGLTREQAQEADARAYAAYYLDPVAGRPVGAESLDDLRRRVAEALDGLHGEGPLLLVAHAVVIRAAIAHAVQGSAAAMMRIPVPYAGLTRLRRDERGWALVRHQGV
jgi:alpha-ribazole phosphatase